MSLTIKKVVCIGLSVSSCWLAQAGGWGQYVDLNAIQMGLAFSVGKAMAEASAKKNSSTSTSAYTPSETPCQQTVSEEKSVITTEGGSTQNRIESLLKLANLKYEIDKDGDYKLRYDMGHGRTQTIWAFANKEQLDEYELVYLMSYAYHGTLTKPQAVELLSDACKVGSWSIQKDKDDSEKVYVKFRAMIPLSISPTDFKTCCEAISTGADELEKKWAETDEF